MPLKNTTFPRVLPHALLMLCLALALSGCARGTRDNNFQFIVWGDSQLEKAAIFTIFHRAR